MKVTIVCDVLGDENNGTTIAAMNLIRSLKEKGHSVRVVCPNKSHEGEEGFYIVPTMSFGDFLNAYIERNGVQIAKCDEDVIRSAIEGADVVHILLPFLLGHKARQIARALDIPITASFHCQAENVTSHVFLMDAKFANHMVYKVFYSVLYKYCDAVHYPTEFIRNVFETAASCTTNAYVISNGVRDIFRPQPVEKPAEYAGKYVILFSGRISKEKNHKVLIDAVARSSHKDEIQLIFAGKGPLEKQVSEYAAKTLTVQPHMGFYSQDELLRVINYSDLYVHPAIIEIEAISCLEAISCGLVPVIANSPRSATRYFALGENNLFDYQSPDDLASKIDYWLDNPQKRAECREGYLDYTRAFAQEACMDKMEQMLADVIAKHAAERESSTPPKSEEE